MSLRTVLITGASGFVGENLARRFRSHASVYLAYRTCRPQTEGAGIVQVDLSRSGSFSRAVACLEADAVVHAAALSSPDACEADPELARAVNVDGTGEVARWAASRGARLIYFSSDQVFDGKKGLYAEQDAPGPVSVYGRTKLEGEERVMRECPDWVVLRLALSYGPTWGRRGDWGWKLRRGIEEGRTLPLFTDQVRTPVYAGDAAEAVFRLAGGTGTGVYHLGGTERLSRYAFGQKIARAFGLPSDRLVPARMQDVRLAASPARDVSLVSERICRDLDLTICDVDTGLRRQKEEETGCR
ncbi:MAG: SDR family oxidoreductase [bacterium]